MQPPLNARVCVCKKERGRECVKDTQNSEGAETRCHLRKIMKKFENSMATYKMFISVLEQREIFLFNI